MTYKQKRRSIRLKGWDYRSEGLYFVTICTHNRENIFLDNRLSDIAVNTWAYIPNQEHAKNVQLDESIVMPNHVHGIIGILHGPGPTSAKYGEFGKPLSGSLGAIIGNYKMLVTKRVKAVLRISGTDTRVWQKGYWERIIRNEREIYATREYMRNNPLRWDEDRENLDTLLDRMDYIDFQ